MDTSSGAVETVERFWRFVDAREAARLRKEAGGPPPHSDDPIIQEWRFCNVYRDLDRGTVWFHANRTDDGQVTWCRELLAEAVWQSVAYRLMNRRETFEAAAADGVWTWRHPSGLEAWLAWLEARAAAGQPLFTGRHIIRGLGPYRESLLWLRAPDIKMFETLQKFAEQLECEAQHGLKRACDWLRAVPGLGPFFAWQVARDLVEAGALPEDDGWALAGPGAVRGAALALPGAKPLEAMFRLRDGQGDAVAALGLRADAWHRPLNLADVEHALCEFARYEDLRTGRAVRAKCGRYAR